MDGLSFDRRDEQLGYVQFLEPDPDEFGSHLTLLLSVLSGYGWRVVHVELTAFREDASPLSSVAAQSAQIIFIAKADNGESHLGVAGDWTIPIKWGP